MILNRGGLTLFLPGRWLIAIYPMWRPLVRWQDHYCIAATCGPFLVRRDAEGME